MSWVEIAVLALLVFGLVNAAVIDPLRRMNARKRREQGKDHDPELIGLPPPVYVAGEERSGSPGCFLMLAIAFSLLFLDWPLNIAVAIIAGIMLALWFSARASPD